MTTDQPGFDDAAPASAATPGQWGSYTAWVRKTIRAVRADRNLLISLFDSSVPEPAEQLRAIVADAFSGPVTSRYTSAFASGNPYVVAKLAENYAVPEDQIICTTGATGAISLIYRALMKPGDRVLVETPCFDLFHSIARTHGAGVDYFQRSGDDFALNVDEIAAQITPRTKLIILSNLHNPSGMETAPDSLAALGRLAEHHGISVIMDEVYSDYALPGHRLQPGVHISPAMISVSSLTKSHGLSTLRCGWIVAAPDKIRPIRSFIEENDFAVSNLSHAIAALVLEQPDLFDGYRHGMMRSARPIMESYHAHWRTEGLVIGSLPPYGCTIFPKLLGIEDTIGFSEWLADRCGVIVAPGEYFGAAGHIRLGFACKPADLDYGLQALTDGLMRYRDHKS